MTGMRIGPDKAYGFDDSFKVDPILEKTVDRLTSINPTLAPPDYLGPSCPVEELPEALKALLVETKRRMQISIASTIVGTGHFSGHTYRSPTNRGR